MTRRPPRSGIALRICVALAACCCLAPVADAQFSADQVGLFFGDPVAGVNSGESATFPAFDSAYLVLLDPTLPEIGGWELRIGTEGPASFLGWQLEGQAVNFKSPPEFVVGLGSPIPAGAQVVLARSDFVVTGPGPVTFSLLPVFQPSLPGSMAYIPFENAAPLTPLATWTGEPAVAFYNADIPVCDQSTRSLDFGVQGLGTITVRSFTITNSGGGVLHLDPELVGTCPPFRITSGGEPVDLGPGQRHTVRAEFRPWSLGEFTCSLDLGTGCDPILLWGMGREAIREVTLTPAQLDFGEVLVGGSEVRTLRVHNSGEVALLVNPTVPDSCDGFSTPGGGTDLLPGATRILNVVFAPTAPGFAACDLHLVDGIPGVPMQGMAIRPAGEEVVVDPPSLDFGTVFVGTGHSRTAAVRNQGLVPVTLDLSLPDACPGYTVWPMDQRVTVAPGTEFVIQVQFLPTHSGVFPCLIDLGLGLPSIVVTGAAVPHDGGLRLQPTALDFGGVAVGSYSERTVTIINEMGTTVALAPSTGPILSGFSLPGSQAGITLPAGGRHTLTVRFQPTALGAHAGELGFGEGLPTVALAGLGQEAVEGWLIEPTAVDFGSFFIGGAFTDREVHVTNTGNSIRTLNMYLAGPYPPFSLIYGGNVSIQPGQRHRLVIRFNPEEPRVYDIDLVIGDVAVVPVTGTGVTDAPRCFLHATNLEFGTVLTGSTAVLSTHITNTGNTGLDLEPEASCSDFLYLGAPFHLGAGETTEIQVAFNPATAGERVCYLDLGDPLCAEVILFGEGSDSLVPDHDLVGVWFDQELATGIRRDLRIGEAVPAWLAMLNPSETAGVGGWELRLDLGDGLILADHQLSGQAYNFEQAPSFFVGLGTPLPYAPEIVLASFEFLVTDTDLHSVDLVPLWRPSIPGALAWVYGEEFLLKEMFPVSGLPSVAWLSAASPVAVTAPTPTARLAGGRVELSWPLPGDGGHEGCHVYRTLGGTESRLTATPLQPDGRGYLFTDDPTGLPAGSSPAYSYGIVRGGVVIARSPAVTVELPGAQTAATRLLPNRPNPFNPETAIHFALERAGSIRLAVYDVTGRRVAVLADGVREAGPGQVTWRGRDDAGRVMPSGAYYVRLESARGRDTRKIMLLK